MNIHLLMPGKSKDKALDELYKYYLVRITPHSKIDLTLLKEETPSSDSQKDIDAALEKEASTVLKRLKKDDFLILCDIHAPELSSFQFQEKLASIISTHGNLVFYIGSSNGISDSLRKRANFSFSLSKLTFTHYHALLILLEQIYRYFLSASGHTYNK